MIYTFFVRQRNSRCLNNIDAENVGMLPLAERRIVRLKPARKLMAFLWQKPARK